MSHDSLRRLFPPELPDELVDALFTFLHKLTDTFDEIYAEQIYRLPYRVNAPFDEPPEPPIEPFDDDDGPPF